MRCVEGGEEERRRVVVCCEDCDGDFASVEGEQMGEGDLLAVGERGDGGGRS